MAVESYPHIKMGVRDDSIFVGLDTSIMPLDKPIFVMKTQKGDPGVPIWCPTYTYACQKFGADTFNKRSKYWSEASYFLMKTLVSNGAYIMRVCEEKASNAKVFIECGVRKADIPQWERNSITGQFTLNDDGSRIPVDAAGQPIKYIDDSGKEVIRTLSQDDLDKMIAAGGEKAIYTFSTSIDTKVVVGKQYWQRMYKAYNYTPYTLKEAAADCVLYFGGLWKADEYKVTCTKEEYDALPDSEKASREETLPDGTKVMVYYRDQTLEDIISEPMSVEQLTPTVVSGNYIWRKATNWDFQLAPKWEEEHKAEYYKFDPSEAVNDFVPAFSKDKEYLEEEDFEYGVHFLKVPEGQLIVVTDLETLDPATQYFLIKYEKFSPQIFVEGATIKEVGVYHTRAPIYSKGFEYDVVDKVSYTDSDGQFHPAEDLAPGDRLESDGSIYHKDSKDVFCYAGNYGQLYIKSGELAAGDLVPQGTISGTEVMWRAVVRSPKVLEQQPADSTDPSSANGFMWYPMLSFSTDNPGKWGESFGFRFYYDRANNTVAGIVQSGAIKYSLAPLELKSGDTTPTAIVDAYGEQTVVGTIRPGVVDPTTDLDVTLKKLVPSKYSGSREIPVSMIILDKNFDVVGKMLMESEQAAKDQIKTIYGNLDYWDLDDKKQPIIETFVDQLGDGEPLDLTADDVGHMANCVSAIAGDKVPYFASHVVGSWDEAAGTQNKIPSVIDMSPDSQFYLMDGEDGDITDAAIESYIRQSIDACVAGTHDYLIDYLRVPYNNVLDTGVSLKTKKAYLDWMGVRDNLTVFLTPQQLWKNADGSTPAQLTRYEDESVGASLRSYGLLMREDVENATEANRCIIFLASGINSDHDYANDGLCASTLWVALKNAEYLNTTKIKDEPIERPNSEIKCYDGGLTWTAAAEETRARCWNAGLNYAQYAEEGVIHYASCRSIYRYDTSVLCDMGTVRAVTFCKDIIRREWAIWAGSKRPAAELNSRITKALNEKCAAMLNGKYTASAKVYQTDEDVKYGYVRHVELRLESPATNRVWLATIICAREGFDPATAEAK